MKRFYILFACAAATLLAQAPPKTHLKVGDMAPDFELPSTAGKKIKLSDYRGKQSVVLAFFPAAFTGGCTKEMQGYQASIQRFEGSGAQIFGISTDNTPSLGEFAKKNSVSFPLISDFANRKASTDYGVLMAERGIANRATFVIDTNGKISYVEEGQSAVDIEGAATACSRLKK